MGVRRNLLIASVFALALSACSQEYNECMKGTVMFSIECPLGSPWSSVAIEIHRLHDDKRRDFSFPITCSSVTRIQISIPDYRAGDVLAVTARAMFTGQTADAVATSITLAPGCSSLRLALEAPKADAGQIEDGGADGDAAGQQTCADGGTCTQCGAARECRGQCIERSACCEAEDCPIVEGRVAACSSQNSCIYSCPSDRPKECGSTCVPAEGCCTTSDCPGRPKEIATCDEVNACQYTCEGDLVRCAPGGPCVAALSCPWTVIAAGLGHSCALKSAGNLYCWGHNQQYQLGTGAVDASPQAPRRVASPNLWTSVTVASGSTCSLSSDKRLYCWGDNNRGILGQGLPSSHAAKTPEALDGDDWTAVQCNFSNCCGLRRAGELFCWGANTYGQAGATPTADVPAPVAVSPGASWKSVSCSQFHCCGIQTQGQLYCWGRNTNGELGIGVAGDASSKSTPHRVGNASDWKAVSAGGAHSCAIKEGGTIWCWGHSFYGQLGIGIQGEGALRTAPTQVDSASDWASVSSGGDHVCARKATGALFCWGRNRFGQLELGTTGFSDDRTIPSRVGMASDWVSVSAGWMHTCGFRSDGTLLCWGLNDKGQIGNPNSLDAFALPTPVPAPD